MGAKVANEGIGEKTPAKGMLLVVGNATRLMDGTLGSCGKFNKFETFNITVFQFMTDKEVQTDGSWKTSEGVKPTWSFDRSRGCLNMLNL